MIPVSVSADVLDEFPELGNILGEGFAVLVEEPDSCVVSVVGPMGPVGVSFLTMAHRRPALLVVDYARPDASAAAACLAAGAAGYLMRPSGAQVAGLIRSLACRPLVEALVS